MRRGLAEGVTALADIQKGQRAAVGQTQRNIQIPKSHITVDAKHLPAGTGQSGGNRCRDRGFSCSALAGQNRDQLTHLQTPPKLKLDSL